MRVWSHIRANIVMQTQVDSLQVPRTNKGRSSRNHGRFSRPDCFSERKNGSIFHWRSLEFGMCMGSQFDRKESFAFYAFADSLLHQLAHAIAPARRSISCPCESDLRRTCYTGLAAEQLHVLSSRDVTEVTARGPDARSCI